MTRLSSTRTLVVTGDDFGASLGANRAIERAHTAGVLTSASLMITTDTAQDAATRAAQLPGLSTGLHLVLCDGKPAADPARIPDLVERDGCLPLDPARVGFALWRGRRRLRDQLELEIHTQCERFLATGLRFDHIDGHHHLHMHPVVFAVVLEAMADYGVGRVRLMHEDRLARRGREGVGAVLAVNAHASLARYHRARVARRPILACDRVYGLRSSGRCDEEWWLWLLPRLRAERVEIYAHPDDEREEGRSELAALCSPRVRDAIGRAGYRLAARNGLDAES